MNKNPVADHKKSIEKANELSTKILKIIMEETANYQCEDDPAEQIYLAVHIVGSLFAKICLALESYGKVYEIPNLKCDEIIKWVNTITAEHIKANKGNL